MQATPLTHKHLHTLEHIFQHPASHNLEWKDVIALAEHLGTVQEEEHGRMKFMLNRTKPACRAATEDATA